MPLYEIDTMKQATRKYLFVGILSFLAGLGIGGYYGFKLGSYFERNFTEKSYIEKKEAATKKRIEYSAGNPITTIEKMPVSSGQIVLEKVVKKERCF